jgi:hypothetical protein
VYGVGILILTAIAIVRLHHSIRKRVR